PDRGGCFAELQVLGEDFVVPLPAGANLDRLVMAQQLGTAVFAFRRFWPAPRRAAGHAVAILGAGSAGLFLLQLARRAGFAVAIVGDRDTTRLEIARDLGADTVVDTTTQPFEEAVAAVTGGTGADLVIEAAGPDTCRTACVEAVRPAGRLGFFGLPEHRGLVPFPLDAAFRKGVTIEMVAGAQREPGLRAFRIAVELIESAAIDVGHLLAPRFPLDRVQEAMDAARTHAGVKVSVDVAGR
ncbi:MAG: zinc-binding dehydrogenase, partial [Acidimicrobiales bacterium]